MKKYLLFASLAFAYANVTAQEQINFKTIDIIKSEDSNPNSFASLSNKIYFFANDGKNYSDYYLWSLEKDSKKIEKSNYTVKGNYYKSDFFGNLDESIYYLDTTDYGNTKFYLLTESRGEEIILSSISNFNILQKKTNYLLISYQKDNIKYLAKVTINGIENLINTQDDSFNQYSIVDNEVYFFNEKKILKFNLVTKSKVEVLIPIGYELLSNYNSPLNYFNGNIYYISQSSLNYQRKIVKLNLNSIQFEYLNIPESSIYNFVSNSNVAILSTNTKVYKLYKDNKIEEFVIPEGYQIGESELVNDDILLQLSSYYNDFKLWIINNQDILIKNDYFLDLKNSVYDNDSFLFIDNNQLKSYNYKKNQELVLENFRDINNILGFDESKIYLNASTKETGKELYAFNKNTNQIEFYGDINARPGTYPKRFYNAGNKVFYEGNYQGYSHLYVSDGTLEGTRVVKPDILLTLNNNSSGNSLDGLEFNGKFLFGGNKGNQSGHELWVTDGSDEGTFEIEINPITVGPHSNISGFKNFIAKTPTKVFFKGFVPDKGEEIWVTDGTKKGTNMVKDLTLGSDSPMLSIPQNVTVGEKLYFVKIESANDDYRSDLWETDGTEQGTKKITELTEFWNWDSHYNIKIFDADEQNLYYSKYYVAPYGEESLSGTYIHRMNLNDLKEERLYRFYSHYNMISVNNENFYFSEYVDNQFNFVNFNKNTGEKKTILKSVSSDFGYITTCGNYSIIADTDFSGHVGKPYFYNHNNGKVERIFKNDFASSSKNNIACVNDNILINYSDYMDNSNKKIVSIKEDKIIEFPLSLDNSTNINSYLSSEMIYNTGLKKLFINPSNVDNELAVADFYLESLSTEEVEGNSKDLNSLILYPNPAENEVNVKSLSYIQTLTIIDFTGKILKEQKDINQKEIKFNISGLKKGIYIIHVKTENETKSKKLIIK